MDDTNAIAPIERGMVATSGLTTNEIAMPEQATAVLSAQVRAEVEAQIIAARRWPRDLMVVRQRLLDACKRPRFAAVSRYAKPMGKRQNEATGQWEQQFVRGWSIRFAEEAARSMGNLRSAEVLLDETETHRLLRVVVGDLETNTYRERIVSVEKAVERSKLRKGQQALRTRINSYGDTTYLVAATEDELLAKQSAATQKAWRNLVVAFVPGDLLDECLDQVEATARLGDNAPGGAAEGRKRAVDAMGRIGVTAQQIAEYLGHPVDGMTPDEARDLIQIGTAIKNGDTTWRRVMESAEDGREQAPAAPTPAAEGEQPKAPRNLSDLAAQAKARRGNGGSKAVRCDGNHGDPACGDPQCWLVGPPPMEPGSEG